MEMKIMQPITVGGITLKNRIMFPPLTTGYEERDGSIGEQSRAFYTRLAQGGVGYIVLGDVAPIRSFSPTPKLFDDSQIESFRLLADSVHAYGAKLGVQIFHPEYDCDAVNALFAQGKMEEVRARLHFSAAGAFCTAKRYISMSAGPFKRHVYSARFCAPRGPRPRAGRTRTRSNPAGTGRTGRPARCCA